MAALIAHLPQLIAALGVGIALVMYLTARPNAYAMLWLLGICFVPWWVGTTVQSFLPVAVILSILGLFCLTPAVPRRITLPDLGVLCFFAACLLPVVVGGSIKSGTFGAAAVWLPAYFVGRRLPVRVGLQRIYGYVTLVFSIVALLAIIEFVFSWNPFIQIHFGSASSYATWGTLQMRGNVLRAEGAFGHSIALGASLALAIPIALASKLRLSYRVFAVALMLGASVVTFSRTAMLCAVLGVFFSIVFLGEGITRRLRIVLASVIVVMAALLLPLINSTFSAASTELTQSADYRDSLTSGLDHLHLVGISDLATRLPDGTLYFGSFRSIDSQFVLTGLTYGAFALIVASVMLLASIVTVLRRHATAPTITLACQIPALATVALITQYSVFFWFVVGLSVASQATRGENAEVEAARDTREAPAAPAFNLLHSEVDRTKQLQATAHHL
jgi:putative effector of murein hydrolase LrgA (UPF0299 family)